MADSADDVNSTTVIEEGEKEKPVKGPSCSSAVSIKAAKLSSGKKLSRKGKSQTLNKLAAQLKFYFSDSNLWKDKFLRQQIAESPTGYVAISVLASFNRVQSLTKDQSLVTQAARTCSPLLHVTANGQYVRRTVPLPPEPDLVDHTIYVENLPDAVDHDMLKRCFSVFGDVAHVSLPKFKKNSAAKGFAFIEFIDSSSASEAVEHFNGDGDDVPSANGGNNSDDDGTDDGSAVNEQEAKLSVSTKAETSASVTETGESSAASRHCEATDKDGGEPYNTLASSKKRHHSEIESDSETEVTVPTTASAGVKRKHSQPATDSSSEDEKSRKPAAKRSVVTPTSMSSKRRVKRCSLLIDRDDEVVDVAKESKKKRRTRSHWRKRNKRAVIAKAFGEWIPIVLAKSSWLQMRDEYKALQRQQNLAVKELLRTEREALQEYEQSKRTVAESAPQNSALEKCTVTEQSTVSQPIDNPAAESSAAGPPVPCDDFVANTVVHIQWSETTDTKPWSAILLKRNFAEMSSVRFVDFQPGDHIAFVRCSSSSSASQFLQLLQAAMVLPDEGMRRPSSVTLLTGDDEQDYWKKLSDSRKVAHEANSTRVRSSKKRRGKQVTRLAALKKGQGEASASTHVVFDEDDGDVN